MWYCWYIYIFLFCSASCDIDIRKHDYIVTFRVVFRGGRPTQSMSIEISFFYIYIPGSGCPIPGELITVLEIFLRQFGDFWQVFEKHTQSHTNFAGLFQGVCENVKRRCRGQFLMSFFLYKKVLIGFFP